MMLLSLVGCGQRTDERAAAEPVLRSIDQLVAAGRHEKAAPLDQLRVTACGPPEACALRDRCVAAFGPMVEADRLQREARVLLDLRDPARAAEIDTKLDRATALQEQSRREIEGCLVSRHEAGERWRL
jgi:hypothetical protein